ncbi:MAG: CAP domain-containing protein [Chloroflexota bacterium]|jgi:LysM repeat protein
MSPTIGWKRLLRRLIGIWLAWLCLATAAAAGAQGDPAGEVIRLVNELRASYGVPPYQVNPLLMQVAQAQASWCAANNHIGHDGPGGSMPNDRAQAAGYGAGYRSYATENQAHGTATLNTPERVVSMWQGDWVHLKAMVSADYEHIGVGFAEANGFSWYILMAGWVADGESAAGSRAAVAGLPATPAPAALPAAPVMLSEPGEDGAIYHEVQSGQAAWTIAARYGLTVEELYALNDLTDSSVIHPGDQLLIRPADTPTPTATTPPTATSPAPTVTNTPIVAKTLTAPPEIAAAFSSPTPVATAATAGIDQTPTGGSTQLAVALIVGAGVALLLLLYFVARAKRRS